MAESFIAFEAARRIVLETVRPLPAERVPPEAALGRALAEPVVSGDDLPGFDNAAMDGFAVRAAGLDAIPAALRVVESLPAGRAPTQPLREGTCAEIMTGAPLPPGADAVVPVEWTERVDAATVRVLQVVPAGKHVRRAGEDVRRGERLFEAGQVVTPPTVTLCVLVGVAEVAVRAVPRVAVIATGNELVAAGRALQPGQVRNANGPGLAAQVRLAGAEPVLILHAPDDPAALREVLDQTREADVVVLSGGVSVGRHDHVRPVLHEAGAEVRFRGVRQRPGKPFTFAVLGGRPVFALPGNPTAAAVCFEAYVRPALAQMVGRAPAARFPARLEEPLPKRTGYHYLARARARVAPDGSLHARLGGPQATGRYAPFARANALLHLPEDAGDQPAGARVEIELLPWASLDV